MAHYEIKLSPLEMECVKRTKGFNRTLPELITSDHFYVKQGPVVGYTDLWGIVPDSEGSKREFHEVRKARDENSVRRKEIEEKYPRINTTRLTPFESAQEFRSQLSQEDLAEYNQLLEKYNIELNKRFADISLKEVNRKWRYLRKLYGILGVVQGKGIVHTYFYRHFIIPAENAQAAHDSVVTGVFAKELESADLFLLGYLLERTKDIKGGKTIGHNPRFSVPRIMKECGGDNREVVKERLGRLTGILCHTYGPEGSAYKLDRALRHVYWQNWFIPFRNFKLAEETIKRA